MTLLIGSLCRFVVTTTNGQGSSTLTVLSATLSMDDGTVQCEARNEIDSERATVILRIKGDIIKANSVFKTNLMENLPFLKGRD